MAANWANETSPQKSGYGRGHVEVTQRPGQLEQWKPLIRACPGNASPGEALTDLRAPKRASVHHALS
jgi:hypothetical protein